MKIISIGLLVLAVFFIPTANAAEFLRETVAKDYDENLEQMFLHFHRNPELSNLESETAKRLAAEIRKFGYGANRDDPGRHGWIAVKRGLRSGLRFAGHPN